MGKIFYIMGKSSSGKDSIYRQLEGNQELGLKRLVIYTEGVPKKREADRGAYLSDSLRAVDIFYCG